ncbi:GNAT family N-acetyltransferase [Arthrobacter castelli]|uniref:GNAT family N-acetyltransferase n=1 Tax=Arthrobacter castelli TaxID=271431 RepID=UPI001FDFE4C2|nr:GNAT family N-acetyltransferase [Arthrobacter castelli]
MTTIEFCPGATVRQDGRMTKIRPARPTDAEDMSEVQNAIYRAGLRASPVDVALIRERYLDTENEVACTVAEQEDRVVGFQSLKRAWPGNPYDVAEGWGIIGTHIHPDAGRSGLGRRLFVESLAAAKAAGLRHLDATIGADNSPALAYYSAMGFTPYQEGGDTIPHRFDV